MQLLRFVCACLLFLSSAAFAQQSILVLKSSPGDPVGGGTTRVFSPPSATLFANSNGFGGVSVSVQEGIFPPQFWSLDFAPALGLALQQGFYPQAERFGNPSPNAPGLLVSGNSAFCNTIAGSFNVREIAFGPFGEIQRFAVDFEQFCDGVQQPLTGELRVNSAVATTIPLPPIITLDSAMNFAGCVEATGPAGAAVKLNATASRDAVGGTNLTFSWTTSSGKTGTGANFSFNQPLAGMPTIVELSMLDRTNGQRQTASKSVCVSDTTPPTIEILSPKQGEVLRGAGPVRLDVRITDAVDKNIKKFNASFGTQGNYSIGPSGRERVQLVRPDSGEQIQMQISVQASDASGNPAFANVNFTRAKRTPGGPTP